MGTRASVGAARRRLTMVVNEAQRSGAPLSALELLRLVDRQANHVTVVVKRPGPLVGALQGLADDVVQPAPLLYRLLDALRWRGLPVRAGRLERFVARRALRRQRADAVWAHTATCADYARAAGELGLPAVLHLHEADPTLSYFLGLHGARSHAARMRLVATSAAVADDAARWFRVPGDTVAVAHPTLGLSVVRDLAREPHRLPPTTARRLVVACGAVEQVKGADLWCDVSRSLARRGDTTCLWVGAGKELGAMRRRVARLGIDGNVKFVGALANPYPLLAAADVVTIPSRREAFSRVAVEAQALGTPVVAFDVGGLRETVAGAGVLVPREDVGAMAEAVGALLDDEAARRRLGSVAREEVERAFPAGSSEEVLRAVLDHLLDSDPRARS